MSPVKRSSVEEKMGASSKEVQETFWEVRRLY